MKTNPLTSLLNNLRQTLRRLLCAHCLGIRAFDGNTRREVYERQQGICPACGRHFEIEEMDADHITPCSKGGRTIKTLLFQQICSEIISLTYNYRVIFGECLRMSAKSSNFAGD